MPSGFIRVSVMGLALLGAGAGVAKANVVTDTVPFVFQTDGSQTVLLPQFDPALGTLTAASAILSGVVEPLLEIFNSGRSQVSLNVEEIISLGTLPARTTFSFGGFIPNNTPVFGIQFPPMPISVATSLNGQLAEFTGPGALPFALTLISPATLQAGTTVTSVSSLASASGTITLDYTYTPTLTGPAPTPVAVPEPGSLAVLTSGLVGVGLTIRRRPTRRSL